MSEHQNEHQNHEGQQHHQPDPQPAQENPAPEPAEAVEAVEAEQEAKPAKERKAPARRTPAKGGELTWAEVESIIEFNAKFAAGTDHQRNKTLEVFSVDADGGPLALAQALKPSFGKIWAFETYSQLARKVKAGQLGFMDGIKIVDEFTNSQTSEIKLFDNVATAFGSDVQYRKNLAITDYVQSIIASIRPDGVDSETFDFIDGLLAVWPGE